MESMESTIADIEDGVASSLKWMVTTGAESLIKNSTSLVTTFMSTIDSNSTMSLLEHTTDGDHTTLGGDFTKETPPITTKTTTPGPYYEYSTAQFEVLLPCIFGMFVTLALSFIVFYSKHTNQYEVLEKRSANAEKPPTTNKDDWSSNDGLGELNGAFSF